MRPHHLGFTLVETTIALAVAGVLLGIALPAFNGTMSAVRSADARNSLLTSLMTASGKAALIGTHAVLCPTRGEDGCLNDPDWSQGWLVFLDRNDNHELDAGETRVHRQPALAAEVRLRSTVGRTRIVFQGNGGNAGSNVTFTICDGRGPAKAEALIISNSGGIRSARASAGAIAATCPR